MRDEICASRSEIMDVSRDCSSDTLNGMVNGDGRGVVTI